MHISGSPRMQEFLEKGRAKKEWEAGPEGQAHPCACHTYTLAAAWWEALEFDGERDTRLLLDEPARRRALERLPRMLKTAGVPVQAIKALEALKSTTALEATRRFWAGGPGTPICLALIGALGAGKTVAGAWAVREALLQAALRPRPSGGPEETAVFITAADLMRLSPFGDADRPLRTARLLVLDELGVEVQHAANRDRAHELLSDRAGRGLRSIFTSNLLQPAIVERYGERLAERLREWGVSEVAVGPSLRRRTA